MKLESFGAILIIVVGGYNSDKAIYANVMP